MANKFVFPADGSQLQTEAKKSSTELRTMQAELKRLETQSKQTHRELVLQAKASGASSEELRKLQQKQFGDQLAFNSTRKQITNDAEAAGRKMVKSEEDKAKAISHVTDELNRQRAAVERLARTPVREEHLEPTDRQKAGALVRGGGLRSAEAFAATIPGFAKFASAVFPLVGGAALVADLSTKVGELREKMREAREAGARIREGFEGISAPIQTTVDTLRKQNAELDISIAKLLHKPENGLKLALAEAALEVDHLADRARSAYDAVRKLLQEQKVGVLGSLMGQGSTTKAGDAVEGGFRDISNLSRDYKDAVRSSGADSDPAKNALEKLVTRRKDLRTELNKIKADINGTVEVSTGSDEFGRSTGSMRVPYEQRYGDQTAQRNIIGGALDVLDNQDDEEGARKENSQKTQTVKRLELQKANATAALAAQKKAAEDQRKQWDDELAAMQAGGKATNEAIHQLWVQRYNITRAGSENHLLAEKESFLTLRKLNEEQSKAVEESIKLQQAFGHEGMKDAVALILPSINANAKGAAEAARTLDALRQSQEAAKIAIAEANVQYGVQAGRISRSDAAVMLQTLHTLQYEGALKRLQMQRDAIQNGPEVEAKRNVIDTQMVDLESRRAVQVMQDQADVAGNSWSESLRRANRLFVQDSQDTARQVSELYQQTLGSLNQNLARGMMGERTDFGGMFRGIGGSLANMALTKVESSVLGRLGMGKADGSKGNPWNVYVVNPVDAKGMGSLMPSPATLSGLLGKPAEDGLMQGIGGVAASTVLSMVPGGALLGSLFGGFRALGGGVDEGKGYVVGEHGPEFFTPHQSGYVTPNDRMQSMFGGRGDNHWNIDARGSHDPAATEAAVQRGIARAAPHIVAASVKANKEQAARRPTGSGR